MQALQNEISDGGGEGGEGGGVSADGRSTMLSSKTDL